MNTTTLEENKSEILSDYQLEGTLLDIKTYPKDPVLKQVAKPVDIENELNDEFKELVKNMLYTMYNAPGIGLAAPQVGVSKRFFVMDIDYDREEVKDAEGNTRIECKNFNPQVFINPVFKSKDGEILYEEGCLSVPGFYEKVKRFETVVVEYYDLDGEKQTIETDGLLSICLQHENDHLDGIVFLERLSSLKRDLILKRIRKQNR